VKWKTAWNVWATASKICRDACSSKLDELRVRKDNPARDVAGPDRGAATGKQYLWPSEFQRFVQCEAVPLSWRRIVALATYLYVRAGELRVLRWEDVDLEHGSVHIHRARDRETGLAKATKTKHARRFNIEPALVPLLSAMHEESGGEGVVCRLPSERVMARALRRWLKRAGVTRSELHDDAPTRKKMTFHDLRATGVTWMAIRGDDPLRIQQRAGHEDFATTQGYIREAESIREGFGDVFPSLPEAILDGGGDDSNRSANRTGGDGGQISREIRAGWTGLETTSAGSTARDRRGLRRSPRLPRLRPPPLTPRSCAPPSAERMGETIGSTALAYSAWPAPPAPWSAWMTPGRAISSTSSWAPWRAPAMWCDSPSGGRRRRARSRRLVQCPWPVPRQGPSN
jgi:site-specific recombinase XerC